MRYTFLKIEDTADGQLAFLLDEKRGAVVVAPVEWMQEERSVERTVVRPRPAIRYVDEQEEQPIMPPRKVPVTVDNGDEPTPEQIAKFPPKSASIVPAHMLGLFNDPSKAQ